MSSIFVSVNLSIAIVHCPLGVLGGLLTTLAAVNHRIKVSIPNPSVIKSSICFLKAEVGKSLLCKTFKNFVKPTTESALEALETDLSVIALSKLGSNIITGSISTLTSPLPSDSILSTILLYSKASLFKRSLLPKLLLFISIFFIEKPDAFPSTEASKETI